MVRKKKVKVKGTLSKEEKKRIKKVLNKYGYEDGGRPAFKYGNNSNTFRAYIYE